MPVARALGKLNRGQSVDAETLQAARRRAVLLGHGVAAVGMGLWVVAGLAFPIFMHVVAGSFPWFGYFHFFLSMFACGIISCCLPFLATTWLSVRVYYPALLASSSPDATEQKRLTELGQQAGLYLLTSPIAPLIALLLVMFSRQPFNPSTGQQVPKEPAMITLVAIAIAGFGAAYVTWQRIRNDLAALAVVSRPADMVGTTSESVDTF
jgi:MFS family permease